MTSKSSKTSQLAHGGARKIQIGEWWFDQGKLTITNGDNELNLEPRTVDLLNYLIQNPDRVISKQELMEHVWKTIVSDNAISRAVVRLRQILNDDPQNPTYITTVPRKGYRLIAPLHIQEQPTATTRLRTWSAAAVIVLLLAAIVLTAGLWSDTDRIDKPDQPMKLVPVTALVGDEIDPAVSADGSMIAFSHRESEGQPWQIKVKKLDTNETFTITPGTKDARLPSWSPDNSKLVYKALSLDYCHISIVDISDLQAPVLQESVMDCNVGVGSGNVIWGGPDVLYFAEADSENAPFVIYRYHLASKNLNQITSPPNSGRGDYRLQLSPDGQWLAFVRDTVYWDQSEVWVHALNSGENRRVATLPVRLRALTWLEDSDHLVVANKDKQLQTIDIETSTIHQLTSETLPLFHPAAGGGKLVTSAGSFHRREIWRAQGNFDNATPELLSAAPYIVSSQSDYLPQLNPQDASVAFVSERSGLPQIWMQDDSGQLLQLTEFDVPYHFRSMHWSPDGSKLAVAASNQLIWLQLADQQISYGPSTTETIAKPIWDKDNEHIYFAQKVDLEWQLFRFSTASNQVVPVTRAGGYRSQPSQLANHLFLSKLHKPGLWKYDRDSGEEILIGNWLEIRNFNRDWVIPASEQYFFFVDPQNISTIQRVALDDTSDAPPVDVIPVNKNWIIDFDVSDDQKTVLYSRAASGDSDIFMLVPGAM